MLKERIKNKILITILSSYLLIVFEMVLFLCLIHQYLVIGFYEFIFWECLSIFICFLFIFLLWTSRKVRLLFSLFLAVVSNGVFIFLLFVQTYTFLEIILISLLGIFLLIFVLILFISKNKKIKKYISFFAIFTGVFYLLIFIFYQKPFFATFIELIIISPISLSCLNYSFKTYLQKQKKMFNFSRLIKITFLLIPIICASFLLFPLKNVVIDPKNSPELIFWSGSESLPEDDDTLNLCAQNDIGFCVVLRDYGRYLSDSAKRNIERLLNHSVITYICIGGKSGEFYCTLNNAKTFEDILSNIRSWLVVNSLYQYENLRGFVIDAETPAEMMEDFGGYSTIEKTRYLIGNVPTLKELESTKKDLDSFIDKIHEDDKDIGIIKLPSFYDEFDDDSDFALLTRNIYSLCKDLDFDFSISMNYRTQHIPRFSDYLIQDMNKYDYTKDYELEYLDESQLERNLVPISQYYYEVNFELNSNELGIDPDDRFIFIGNFNPKFKDTTYIKEKQYKKDLDICRHFNCKQVWFYEWRTFIKSYNNGELNDLIRHNEDLHVSWILTVSCFSLNRELLYSVLIGTADTLFYIY